MATDCGRVLSVGDETVTVWDGEAREVPLNLPIPDLEDASTYLICLGFLCSRTGLDPSRGCLFYLNEDGDEAWVLEGTDEVRTRDADTDDPLLALARGLAETA